MKTTTTNTVIFTLALALFTTFTTSTFAQSNFTAEFDDGDLTIVGENNAEQALIIESLGQDGSMRLTATGEEEVTVNGQDSVDFHGVTGDVTIDMRSGTKLLVLSDSGSDSLFIGGDLEVKNRGNFPLIMILDEVDVAGKIDVKTKNGDDAFIIHSTTSGERTKINTANGNDAVLIVNDSIFTDELEVKTGGGADYLMMSEVSVVGETDIRMGGQNDTVGLYISTLDDLTVNGNGGTDAFEESNVLTTDFTEKSIEEDFAGGIGIMFTEARNQNEFLNDAFILFSFLGLSD